MAATRQEKLMRMVAQAYVDTYGTIKNIDVVLDSGNHLMIVAPNRFGPGYIRIAYPHINEVWSADLHKDGKRVMPIHGEIINQETSERKQIR